MLVRIPERSRIVSVLSFENGELRRRPQLPRGGGWCRKTWGAILLRHRTSSLSILIAVFSVFGDDPCHVVDAQTKVANWVNCIGLGQL